MISRLLSFLLLVAAVTIVLSASLDRPPAAPPVTPAGAGEARVVRIVDGDTLDLEVGGSAVRARLLGIDTPESVDPRRPVQCFGHEATEFLAATVPPGTVVRLERDIEPRDAYDRLLVYAYRAGDGLFVNDAIVRNGFGTTLSIAPNRAHASELEAARLEARRAGRGLWGVCGEFGVPLSSTPP